MSKTNQPKLSELFERYLNRQTGAHADGLATFDPKAEVIPYEAGPVQPVDPKSAWTQALLVLQHLQGDTSDLTAPPHWPELVSGHEPIVSFAFAVGNYPQLMRNLHSLLQQANLEDLRPIGGRTREVPELIDWATEVAKKGEFAQMLVALGAMRLAKQFDEAGKYLETNDATVPNDWRAAWENEKAALAWHRADAEQALKLWQAQPESVPVLFNRGMALLFLNRGAEAVEPLNKAVSQLSEDSPWHHLGQLYLSMAQK